MPEREDGGSSGQGGMVGQGFMVFREFFLPEAGYGMTVAQRFLHYGDGGVLSSCFHDELADAAAGVFSDAVLG